MKKVFLVIAAMLFVLSATSCSKGDDTQQASVSEPYIQESQEQSPPEAAGGEESNISLELAASLCFDGLDDPDENHRVYSVDEDSVTFGFWVDGLGALANLYPVGAATSETALQFQEDWNGIVSAWSVDMYNAFRGLISTSQVPDAHIVICLLDDRNPENVMLGIYDGEVMTDIVNGIEK